MIIEQPEHLRAWLSQVLQPLCDADPNALAKYVIALVKKDRDEGELRQSMRDQLDVFLQSQTESFVDRLFAVLKSREYVPEFVGGAKPTTNLDVLEIDSGASSDIAESEASMPGAISDDISSECSHKSTTSTSVNKAGPKKEEDDRDRTRSRRKITTRSPPHRDSQGSRNYSTGGDSSRYSGNNHDQNTRSSWADRNQRRPIRARRRSRSRPRTRRHRHDYSRSRSPIYPYGDSTSKSKEASSSQKPGREGKEGSSATASGGGGTKSGSSKHEGGGEEQKPRSQSNNRCRDYDEKGLCMRGDLCPYDHGVNPVVLEDSLKGDYMQVEMQDGFPSRIVRVGAGQYGPGPDGHNHPWPPQGFGPRGFMDGRGPRPGPPLGQYSSAAPRLLVDIPVIGVPALHGQDMMNMDMPLRGMPRGAHPGRGFYMGARGRGRGGFDRGRLGMKSMKINCSLQVKKIPIESNNIMALNGHFSKFGKIINIQINFENDPEAALVTFSTPEEAFRAYKSTEAVLNNRFVRVHWHNKEKENEDGESTGSGRMSVKDRLGDHVVDGEPKSMEDVKIFPPGENFPKHNFPPGVRKDPTTERLEKVEAIKKSQEMLAAQETLRKALEEKKKETLKLMNNLKIRKGDMLKEHIEHQKKLIKKLETDGESMPKKEKEQLLGLMASLQKTIEKIKSDIDGTLPPPEPSDPPPAAGTTQRDILDAELDLYNREQEGEDLADLKRKVVELRSMVPSKRGRGGLFRNSHIGGFHTGESLSGLRSVDRRTTTIYVAGYDPPTYEEILTHFKKYGTINAAEQLDDQTSAKLTFSNRKEAELAKSNGKVFAGRALEIQWVDKPNERHPALNSTNGSNLQSEEIDENRASDTDEPGVSGTQLEQLYDQCDEDEEQDGERSWRR